ncbi:jg5649 [Pararge aegeria aegeria]|uniref:Tetraspanin n=2 Tax=Pararge aegeria TaxID=116150 RepID=A0A8S4QS84_9NEOP|nr:jg5649 [Pararge aegeria aegeria]
MKTLKYLMMMITTKFMILSILMIVLGFSMYARYHTFSFFYNEVKSGEFLTPALFTFVLGIFLLIVTLFGFFGTLKESTCLVNLYALILTILLILKFVAVILALSLDTATIRAILHIPVTKYVSDSEIEMEIDQLQVSLNCCGSESYLDYVGMEFTSKHSTSVFLTIYGNSLVPVVVPASCCATEGVEYCATMRTTGCSSALISFFMRSSNVLGVLGIAVTMMKLLGIIFAVLLARCIRKAKSERGLISWRINELAIAARENEARNQSGN